MESFIFQESLYVYGGLGNYGGHARRNNQRDLFALNLSKMGF